VKEAEEIAEDGLKGEGTRIRNPKRNKNEEEKKQNDVQSELH
jgi:hypothetical protein